jgi:hypothetical protein
VKAKDEANRVVSFHVGTTAWSWGYNMELKVASGENNASNVSIEIARSGGEDRFLGLWEEGGSKDL